MYRPKAAGAIKNGLNVSVVVKHRERRAISDVNSQGVVYPQVENHSRESIFSGSNVIPEELATILAPLYFPKIQGLHLHLWNGVMVTHCARCDICQ